MTQDSRLEGENSRLALALLLLIAAVGWLTMSGHTYARDEETVFAVAQSLFDRHQFSIPEGLPVVTVQRGVSGVGYAPYGPLQSVLLAPVYGASKLLWGKASEPYTGYASRFAAAMFNPLVHAATASLLFLLARLLLFSVGGSLFSSLVYAFATWAWPHSRTQFTEPLTGLFLLTAFYLLLRAKRPVEGRPRPRWVLYALSGLCVALAIATRAPTAIVLPVYGLYILWLCWRMEATAVRLRFGRFMPALIWVVGFLAGLLPYMALNTRLFGGPLATGYGNQGESFLFATPLYTGLYGLLLSPGKGALWYAPALLLFPAWPLFWKRARPETLFCAGTVAITLIFHATVRLWAGGGAWGPRYLTTALPFAILPLAALFGPGGWLLSAGSRGWRALRSLTIWFLVAGGVIVNLLGSVVNFDAWVVSADEDKRNFEPAYSAIAAHPRILAERVKEWLPSLAPPQGVLLRDGFSYSEGKDGAPLPRWTHSTARLSVRTDAPATYRLVYADHRPPPLPRAHVELWFDGMRLDVQPKLVSGVESELVVPIPRSGTLELRSDTWNPAALKQSDRDEDIGVLLSSLTRSDGTPIRVEALPQIPAMPASGFGRWAWFYRTDYHHAVDHWAWYLNASGAPPVLAARLVLLVFVPSAVCLLCGLWLLLSVRSGRRGRASEQVESYAGSS